LLLVVSHAKLRDSSSSISDTRREHRSNPTHSAPSVTAAGIDYSKLISRPSLGKALASM
jgi:hypothetical protein